MAESVQGMENKNRIIMWMTLSTYLALAIAQHVDNAVNVNSVPKSGSESASLERKPHEKYMIDLYNIMFDKKGKPRKGIATMDDGISCFLPEVSNSNSKISLTFDIRGLKKDEQIIKAYLIFPIEQPESVRSTTRFSPSDADDDTPPSPLSLNRDGWKSTDVTDKVKSWHKRRRKENTIHVSPGIDKNMQTPFLVVHSRINTKRTKRSANENENEAGNLSKRDQRFHYTRGSNSQSCRKEKMVIDVKAIGYEKNILSPLKINANRCEGVCGPVYSTASKHETWHSRVQSSAAFNNIIQDGERVKPPCCSPVEYEPIRVLMVSDNVKLETVTDLVVKSCGCF